MTWAGESVGNSSGLYVFTDDGSPEVLSGSAGQLVRWGDNGVAFINETSITGVAPSTLEQIGDVDVTGREVNSKLKWSGSQWTIVNESTAEQGKLNTLHVDGADVNVSTTSVQFIDIPGASGYLYPASDDIGAISWFSFDCDTVGVSGTLEVRVNISGIAIANSGELGQQLGRVMSGGDDRGIGIAMSHVHPFASGETICIKAQYRSTDGVAEVRIRNFSLFAMTEEGAVGPAGPAGPSGATGPAGPVGTVDTIAAVWAYSTTTSGAGFPTQPTPLPFQEVHEVTRPEILNRDTVDLSRFNVYSDGLYAVSYSCEGEQSAQLVYIAAFINGVEHSGTRTIGGEYHHPQAHEYFINRIFVHDFASGDYVQIKFWESTTDSATLDANANFMMWRVEGYQGPAGVSGAAGRDGVDGSGDLTGPGSSVAREIAVFDDGSGKTIAAAQIVIGGSGHMHNAKTITFESEFDNGNSGASYTINWNESQKQAITLSAATPALSFVDPSGTSNMLLRVDQDATGGRNPSWPSNVKWAGGTKPDLASSTGNQTDICTFYYNGTNYYGVASLDFF